VYAGVRELDDLLGDRTGVHGQHGQVGWAGPLDHRP
jgi:hypothetical protein